MNTFRKQSIVALTGTLLSATMSLHAAGVGTSGANFLKVGVGSRALAMAGTAVSTVDDANAIYWNPAALTRVEHRALSASYNALFEDQSQGFIGAATALPDKLGVAGVGINYLAVSNIEKRAGDTESADSTFKNQNYAAYLSYAREAGFLNGLAWGANLKMIHESLDNFSKSAVAVDLGSTYRVTEKLTSGLVLQNIGTKLGPDSLPLLMKVGADYRFLHDKLTLASDIDGWLTDKRYYANLGAEYRVVKVLALRAGYQFGHAQDRLGGATGLSAGMGFSYRGFGLDYAFVPYGDLGNTHRISFGVRF